MIISRRPNKRASTDRAPGPSSTIALATVITRIANNFASTRLGAGEGNHENRMPAQPNAAMALAAGVRNPSNSDAPQTIASKPATLVLNVGSAEPVR